MTETSALATLRLRRARLDDIESIQRVGVEADSRYAAEQPELVDGESIPRDGAERAIATGRLIVAELDDALVGWALVGRVGGELCLGHIAVATAAGRRGVGTALLRLIIDEARAASEPSIVLNTQRDVPWNAPWYARHGFVELEPSEWTPALDAVARDQRAAGIDWSERVHMRLRLADA